MKHVWGLVLVSALLAAPAGASELEERATPSLYAGFSFGGAAATRDARLGLRVDAPVHGGERIEMARWELRADAAEFALAGLPIAARSWGYALDDEPSKPRFGSTATWWLVGAAATVGVIALADQAADDLMDSTVSEGEGTFLAASGVEDQDDAPACESIEIADNCVGGGG